jgi:hypothetical protein
MLVLLMVGSRNIPEVGCFQKHVVRRKFHENYFIGSKLISGGQTHEYDNKISRPFLMNNKYKLEIF